MNAAIAIVARDVGVAGENVVRLARHNFTYIGPHVPVDHADSLAIQFHDTAPS